MRQIFLTLRLSRLDNGCIAPYHPTWELHTMRRLLLIGTFVLLFCVTMACAGEAVERPDRVKPHWRRIYGDRAPYQKPDFAKYAPTPYAGSYNGPYYPYAYRSGFPYGYGSISPYWNGGYFPFGYRGGFHSFSYGPYWPTWGVTGTPARRFVPSPRTRGNTYENNRPTTRKRPTQTDVPPQVPLEKSPADSPDHAQTHPDRNTKPRLPPLPAP